MTNGNSARSGARTPPDEDPTDDDKYAVIDDTGVDTPSGVDDTGVDTPSGVDAAPISTTIGAADEAQHYDPASSS